jgi:hypothetical protein
LRFAYTCEKENKNYLNKVVSQSTVFFEQSNMPHHDRIAKGRVLK